MNDERATKKGLLNKDYTPQGLRAWIGSLTQTAQSMYLSSLVQELGKIKRSINQDNLSAKVYKSVAQKLERISEDILSHQK